MSVCSPLVTVSLCINFISSAFLSQLPVNIKACQERRDFDINNFYLPIDGFSSLSLTIWSYMYSNLMEKSN